VNRETRVSPGADPRIWPHLLRLVTNGNVGQAPSQNSVVRSIDRGVVRLCERLLHHDPPTDEEVHQAREWVARETKAAVADMDNYQATTFVGTAGTVTSLAAMVQKLPAYEPARIHNYRLQLETIQELEQMLLSRKKADRAGIARFRKRPRRSHSRRRDHHPDGDGDVGTVEYVSQRSGIARRRADRNDNADTMGAKSW